MGAFSSAKKGQVALSKKYQGHISNILIIILVSFPA